MEFLFVWLLLMTIRTKKKTSPTLESFPTPRGWIDSPVNSFKILCLLLSQHRSPCVAGTVIPSSHRPHLLFHSVPGLMIDIRIQRCPRPHLAGQTDKSFTSSSIHRRYSVMVYEISEWFSQIRTWGTWYFATSLPWLCSMSWTSRCPVMEAASRSAQTRHPLSCLPSCLDPKVYKQPIRTPMEASFY